MKWNRGPVIGRGSFATVSIATTQPSQTLAVKSTQLSKSCFLQKEQKILSKLNCPQIVGYRGFDITTENNIQLYNLFLEYAPFGTLLDVIHKHACRLPHSMIQSYTKSILLGLNYLHNNGIVHCDIKGQNILVDEQGGAKITDFGCAKLVICGENENKKFAGTPLFMAPEVARGEHQGFPADVWALGCTVIQIATGKAPWSGFIDPASALYEIGFSDNVPQLPSFLSEQAKDFLSKCFVKDPVKRWSVSQLLEHEFICSHIGKIDWMISPTSVLSQSVWESTSDSTLELCSDKSSGNSAMERIRKLVFSNEELQTWECDVDWITVRSNDTSHCMVSGRHLEDDIVIVTHASLHTYTSGFVRDMSGWSCQDFEFLICYNKSRKFSGKCMCNTMIISGNHIHWSCQQLLLLLCMVISRCNPFVGRNQLMELELSAFIRTIAFLILLGLYTNSHRP